MDRNETVRISRLAAFPLNNVGQERKLLQIF
jgi:hypothetical protein